MQINFQNSSITAVQMGNCNAMNFSNSVITEDEWRMLQREVAQVLKIQKLDQEHRKLLQETERIVKSKNQNCLKEFVKVNAGNLLTGTLANLFSSGILNIFMRL